MYATSCFARPPPHGAFEVLQGNWAGTFELDGESVPATLTAGKALDGCSVVTVLEFAGTRTLSTIAYSDFFKHWFIYQLDDQPGTTHTYFMSPEATVDVPFDEARQLTIEDEFTRFVTKDLMASRDSLRRLVWESLGPDTIAWREETRASPNARWQTHSRYEFRRKEMVPER